MTHFVGILVTPGSEQDSSAHTDILGKFDENREVPDYIENTRAEWLKSTREDALHSVKFFMEREHCIQLEDIKKRLDDGEDADTVIGKVVDGYKWTDIERLEKGIAKIQEWEKDQWDRTSRDLTLSDDDLFKQARDLYEDNVDEDGNIHSTYNPDSKWDWYVYGGRFSDVFDYDVQGILASDYAVMVEATPAEPETKNDGDDTTSASADGEDKVERWIPGAIVYRNPEDGEPTWDEDGPVGWFGYHEQDVKPEDWKQHVLKVLREHGDEHVFFIDFHI